MKFVKNEQMALKRGYTIKSGGISGFTDLDVDELKSRFDNIDCVCYKNKYSYVIYTVDNINNNSARNINKFWLKELRDNYDRK